MRTVILFVFTTMLLLLTSVSMAAGSACDKALVAANKEITMLTKNMNNQRHRLGKLIEQLQVSKTELANAQGQIKALQFDKTQCDEVVKTLNRKLKQEIKSQ